MSFFVIILVVGWDCDTAVGKKARQRESMMSSCTERVGKGGAIKKKIYLAQKMAFVL